MRDRDWQAEVTLQQQRERKARAILGVLPGAGREQIRQAFRRASLASHPDTNPGEEQAEQRFGLVCCAYRFLTEGLACKELDEVELPPKEAGDVEYFLDNPWGYWCWWREKYFGEQGTGE